MRKSEIGPIRQIRHIGLSGFFLTALFLFSGASSALAQSPVSLRVAPLSYDLVINPGEEKKISIGIENPSDEDLDINVEFSDFFADDGGKFFFPDKRDREAIEKYKLFFVKDWFRVDKENFGLSKGKSEVVDVFVSVPEGANLGGHYGAVFFRTGCALSEDEAVASTDKSRICVSARPGVLFLVQVGGGAVRTGKLNKFEAPHVSFRKEENVSVELENTGNTHFRPEGAVTAKTIFGKEVFRLDVKDKTILPGASRDFSGILAREDFSGIYKILGSVRDGEGKEIKFQKWIFLVPWKELAVILGIIALWWWFLRKYKFGLKQK